jgi:hypothetical protein
LLFPGCGPGGGLFMLCLSGIIGFIGFRPVESDV